MADPASGGGGQGRALLGVQILSFSCSFRYKKLQNNRSIEGHCILSFTFVFALFCRFFEETFQKVTPKCVVVMRNLKDVLVSYYHFYKCVDGFGHFTGTFSDYLELFKAKRLCQGDWFDFNLGWWKQNGDSRFHFAKYEEMKIDRLAFGEILTETTHSV